MTETLIHGGTIVNRGESWRGYVVVSGDRIKEVGRGDFAGDFAGRRIDAGGMLVMPGVIDDQVHFREPGLTWKGDIHSESAAAVAGGVTSYMEMPNTNPPAVSAAALDEKFMLGERSSVANYSFYMGATNDNIDEIRRVDPRRVCGVKVFMGSSTGNMLVDDERALSAIFAESPVLIAAHCEYEPTIRETMAEMFARYGNEIDPAMHPVVRSAEACYRSSAAAVGLADKYGANLHVLHLSTARELSLFDARPLDGKKITNEVCVHHLWFCDADYRLKGNLIKWNPAIKSAEDRAALREGINTGKVDVVATDHAPHTLEEKRRPYWECPSGGPLVQHSLRAMLRMSDEGLFPVTKVVEKMCHAPAVRFRIKDRGFLDPGAYADIAIVSPTGGAVVSPANILYKCGWSPFEGVGFAHEVRYTLINGCVVNDNGRIDTEFRGRPLEFDR